VYVTVPHARPFLLTGFVLLFAAAFTAVYLTVRMAEAEQWVAHSLDVQQKSLLLLTDLEEAENGQRSYLLVGDEAYLEQFKGAMATVPARLADLRHLTRDNPKQQQSLDQLNDLINARLAAIQDTLNLERQKSVAAAVDAVKTGHGKELMDKIRTQLDAFYGEEFKLLTARQAEAAATRWRSLVAICSSLAAAIGFALVLARGIQRAIGELRDRTIALEAEVKLRRDTQDALRQAQKMEAVGQLTGGIAHDFNNLLTIILGNLDNLQRRLSDSTPAQSAAELAPLMAKPLDLAVQGAKSAAQLTHQLLTFSRRQALAPERLDLNRLVSEMTDLLRRTLGETINLETILAGGLWPTFADKNEIENAVINLCVNARDAMPAGGRLTIETANAYLDDAYASQFDDVPPGQYVLLSVADSGDGIPRDLLDRIFEPFFTTKPVGKGSGLGLAMVHGLVKQSGGHIRVYSEVDYGTTVKIYLPRLVQDEQPIATPAAKAASCSANPRAESKETILLVEDNMGVRHYAKSALEELGYSVIEAGNVADAMRFVRNESQRIDLLFTDVVLPDATGRVLSDQSLKLRPYLPVLFTTGYTRNAIIHHGRLDADVRLLSKPYTQQNLARKIREALDQRRFHNAAAAAPSGDPRSGSN
jgi:signal transduction histidine kinase/ActR/RegA family two-component response regulator